MTPLDTSYDEDRLKSDENYRRGVLRDRIRSIREQSLRDFRDQRDMEQAKYRRDVDKYKSEESDRRAIEKEAVRQADKDAKESAKLDERMKKLKQAQRKAVNAETLRVGKAWEKALKDYDDHDDEDKLFDDLAKQNIQITDEDRKALVKNTLWWDSLEEPEAKWFKQKAVDNIKRQAGELWLDAQESGGLKPTAKKLMSADELE